MPRIGCCVPFCRRNTTKPFKEWLCDKHWKSTDPVVRKQMRTLIAAGKVHRAFKKWEYLKRQAIERAMVL